ncbi:sugar transferase [Hoeflea sp.]|uniref:sugar transferase n=1 Tax=Hoeflea sp. TaxID=1940281 RepID=UPI003B52A9CB
MRGALDLSKTAARVSLMRIVVTGASGYVGRHIVPLLAERGADLLLCGRDKARLGKIFPSHSVCDYSDLAEAAKGYTTLVHLAVLNSNSGASDPKFVNVNVEEAKKIAELARGAGITTFINVSSIHALDPALKTSYAMSKRRASREIRPGNGLRIVHLYLPYVYDAGFQSRFRFAGRLPGPLGRVAFEAATALKPAVSISRIAGFISAAEIAENEDPETSVVLSDGQRHNRVFQIVKRTLDLAFAVLVLGFLWWLLLLVWGLVRLDSPGPGLFRQERIGKDGVPFTCYKFRSMKTGTVQAGTHEVGADAITRLGSWLRRSKIDELPQVINLLRNEMSLIGPRPCLPSQLELIGERRRRGVLSAKPGITGLSQVNGVDMRDPARLARSDADYLALQSLTLDIRIALATVSRRMTVPFSG